ncbi:Sec-independent protein translocase subunit TatA [Streptomyces sp. NPDC001817]|uniref:Sec-independent protein translocase subunit TatA n=1 Tax=Streptomyces sp. NPDC001817 TaxID=3154398 RepID=UPI0033324769
MLGNGLEPWQLLIVAIVIILVFGSKKLPDTTRGLGRSMRILKPEAKAPEDEGAARSTTASTEGTTPPSTKPVDRVLRAVPNDSSAARPAADRRRVR